MPSAAFRKSRCPRSCWSRFYRQDYTPRAPETTSIPVLWYARTERQTKKLGRLSRYMQFKEKDPQTVAHSISADQPSIQDDFTILDGFYHAPTVLTLFTKNHKYAYEDAAMMGENIMLAAHFLGIGACYIGRTDEVFATEYGMEMRRKWGVPDDMVAVSNILLGYLDGPAPHDKPRKPGRIIRV